MIMLFSSLGDMIVAASSLVVAAAGAVGLEECWTFGLGSADACLLSLSSVTEQTCDFGMLLMHYCRGTAVALELTSASGPREAGWSVGNGRISSEGCMLCI
jgi:hypothetical protein